MRESRITCNGCPECIGCGRKTAVEVMICDICGAETDELKEIGGMELCWECEYDVREMIENDEDLTEEYAAYILSMGIKSPINCKNCKQREACKDMGDYPHDGFRKNCDGYEQEETDDDTEETGYNNG